MAAPAFLTQIVAGPDRPTNGPELTGYASTLVRTAVIASLLFQPSAAEVHAGTQQRNLADAHSRGIVMSPPPPSAPRFTLQRTVFAAGPQHPQVDGQFSGDVYAPLLFSIPQATPVAGRSVYANYRQRDLVDSQFRGDTYSPLLSTASSPRIHTVMHGEPQQLETSAFTNIWSPFISQLLMQPGASEYQFGTHQTYTVDSQFRGAVFKMAPISIAVQAPPIAHLICAAPQLLEQPFADISGQTPPTVHSPPLMAVDQTWVQVDQNDNPSAIFTSLISAPTPFQAGASEYQFGRHQRAVIDSQFRGVVFKTPTAPIVAPTASPPGPINFTAPQQYDVGYGTLFKPARYLLATLVWQVNGDLEQPPDVQPWVRGPLPPSGTVTVTPSRPTLSAFAQHPEVLFARAYGPLPPSAAAPQSPPTRPVNAPVQQWGDYNYSSIWFALPAQFQMSRDFTTWVVSPQPQAAVDTQLNVDVYGPTPPSQVVQSPLLRTTLITAPQQNDPAAGFAQVYGTLPPSTVFGQLFASPTFIEQQLSYGWITCTLVPPTVFFPRLVLYTQLQESHERDVASGLFPVAHLPTNIVGSLGLVGTTASQALDSSYGLTFLNATSIPNTLPQAPPLSGVLSVLPQQYDLGYGDVTSPLQVILIYPGRTHIRITTKLTIAKVLPDDIA